MFFFPIVWSVDVVFKVNIHCSVGFSWCFLNHKHTAQKHSGSMFVLLRGDQNVTSLFFINTLLNRWVMRIEKSRCIISRIYAPPPPPSHAMTNWQSKTSNSNLMIFGANQFKTCTVRVLIGRNYISRSLKKKFEINLFYQVINVGGTQVTYLLRMCQSKFDCLIYEMLFIKELKSTLNIQSDSICAKLFL